MDRAELKARARAQLGGGIFQNLWMMGLAVCLLIGLMESAAAGILPGIGALIVVGPLEYGMAFIFLKQARDHQPVQLGDMFRGFQDDFGGTFLIGLMTSLFTFLWSLLFVIPGIIASYRYAMAPFILAEHPEMQAGEAITASKEMMQGNKFRLFCLELSFIGWSLLCAVPAILLMSIAGVYSYRLGALITVPMFALSAVITWGGSCFLSAYISAAAAAFYRDISRGPEAAEPEDSPWDSAY